MGVRPIWEGKAPSRFSSQIDWATAVGSVQRTALISRVFVWPARMRISLSVRRQWRIAIPRGPNRPRRSRSGLGARGFASAGATASWASARHGRRPARRTFRAGAFAVHASALSPCAQTPGTKSGVQHGIERALQNLDPAPSVRPGDGDTRAELGFYFRIAHAASRPTCRCAQRFSEFGANAHSGAARPHVEVLDWLPVKHVAAEKIHANAP